MICANPTLCYIDKQTNKRIFRSFNLATNEIKQADHILFNCNKCITCRKRNARELARRCVLHASLYHQNCFLTLTYSDENRGDNSLDYSHIQKFKKRLRKHCKNKKIEIFNVHEYGKKGNKHWHLVVFNYKPTDLKLHKIKNNIPLYTSETIERLWPFGFNTVGDVSEASAMYQSQYTQKDIINGNENNSKKSKSNHSGIGKKYFEENYKQILSLGYIPFGSEKMPIPRYFEKIAHKHYSHFYETSNFFPHCGRKKGLYTPFKQGQENREIADLYIRYKFYKDQKIKEKESDWHDVIEKEFDTKEIPDFIKSAQNQIYELTKKQKISKEKF